MEKLLKKPIVLRLTVDEKLSDDLIRLLISRLAAGTTEFHVMAGEWEAESEFLVGPATFAENMEIPDDKKSEYPWEKLREGQVFLSGDFTVEGDEKAPDKFAVVSARRNFLRIDDLVRRGIKKLYFNALEGRKASCRQK